MSHLIDQPIGEMLLADSGAGESDGDLHRLESVALLQILQDPVHLVAVEVTQLRKRLQCLLGILELLREHLTRSPHDGWLCWYGDHVPILPKVYETAGYPDGRTDYFIWGTGRSANPAGARDLRVEELGVLLLQQAGLLEAGNRE